MASADFCRPIGTFLNVPSTRQTDRSPRVMRVTFLPYTRHIYSTTLPDDYWALKIIAFSPEWDCLVCDFCSSGQDLPAASFRFHLAVDTLAVQLAVPVIRVRRGLSPPSHHSATTVEWMVLPHPAPCRAHNQKTLNLLTEGFLVSDRW